MSRCEFTFVNKFDSFIQKRDEIYIFTQFTNLTQQNISNAKDKNSL